MAIGSGLSAQLGIAEENSASFGTFITPDRFFELVNESLKLEVERIASQGIRTGRRTMHRWAAGVQRVTGDFTIELPAQEVGVILKHLFGSASTTTAGSPYTHTFTPGALDDKSLTIQVGRPSIDGTVRPFSYLGCKFVSWELSLNVNEYAQLRCSVYGTDEDTSESLASASYDSAYNPFVYTKGSLTIAGSSVDVKEVSLSGENGLATDRHFIRSTNPAQPKEALEAEMREYSGSLTADFEDLTAYNRFVNGTEAALVLTLDAGSSAKLIVTTNVRFDGETPNVGGKELLEQSLPFVVTSGTSDAAAITAALTNTDSTP